MSIFVILEWPWPHIKVTWPWKHGNVYTWFELDWKEIESWYQRLEFSSLQLVVKYHLQKFAFIMQISIFSKMDSEKLTLSWKWITFNQLKLELWADFVFSFHWQAFVEKIWIWPSSQIWRSRDLWPFEKASSLVILYCEMFNELAYHLKDISLK